jgi:hypothetical protein
MAGFTESSHNLYIKAATKKIIKKILYSTKSELQEMTQMYLKNKFLLQKLFI